MRRDEFLYSYCAIQSRAQIRLEQSEKYNSAKIFAVLENKESFLLYCAERGTVDKDALKRTITVFSSFQRQPENAKSTLSHTRQYNVSAQK